MKDAIINEVMRRTEADLDGLEQASEGVLVQALSAGMRPAMPGVAYVPGSVDAVRDATCWIKLKEGEQLTAESAGRAVGTVAKAAKSVNFSPAEFSERLREMAGIN